LGNVLIYRTFLLLFVFAGPFLRFRRLIFRVIFLVVAQGFLLDWLVARPMIHVLCISIFALCIFYLFWIASRCVILYLFIVLAAPCVPLDMAMPMLEAQIDAVTIYLEGWSAPSNQCCQI
jgi:hypothetical protein